MKSLFYLLIMLCSMTSIAQKTNKNILVSYQHIINLTPNHNYESKALLQIQGSISLYSTTTDIKEKYEENLDDYKKLKFAVSYRPDGYVYKNLETKKMTSNEFIFSKSFIVADSLRKINWEITNEKQIIATYECQKAIGEFRGRMYTAWFTTDIPISTGPWKLWGLPGLILEAYDEDKVIQCLLKSLSIDSDITELKPPKGRKKITWEKYKQLTNKKHKELAKFLKSKSNEGVEVNVSITEKKAIEKTLFENEK